MSAKRAPTERERDECSENPVQRAQLLELADDTESAGAFEPAAIGSPRVFVRASELPIRGGGLER